MSAVAAILLIFIALSSILGVAGLFVRRRG